jgi:hypothetical protein
MFTNESSLLLRIGGHPPLYRSSAGVRVAIETFCANVRAIYPAFREQNEQNERITKTSCPFVRMFHLRSY